MTNLVSLIGGKLAAALIAALAFAGAIVWIKHLRAENAALAANYAAQGDQLDRLTAANRADQQAIDVLQAQTREALAAVAAAHRDAEARLRRAAILTTEIDHAPQADRDRIIGPVLGAALDGLREHAAAAAGGAGSPAPP